MADAKDRLETQAPAILVTSGLVRDGFGIVEGTADPALAGLLCLQALSPDGAVIAAAPISPGDRDEQGLVRFTGRIQLDGFAFPVQECRIVAEEVSVTPAYDRSFQLRNLYYATPALFAKADVARNRNTRPADTETQMFMARQMASMFSTELNPALDEPRLLMTCAYAYRAADVRSASNASQAIVLIDRFVKQLLEKPSGDLTNRRLTSLLTAKWHAAAIVGDVTAFEAALNGLYDLTEAAAENALVFAFHFNPVRSLMVLAGYSILAGNLDRATDCFAGIKLLLSSAGRMMTFHIVHLSDFAKSCQIASVIGHFEELFLKRGEEPIADFLTRPIPRLRGTLSESARAFLIRPCVRSQGPDFIADQIRSFVPRTA